MFAMVLNNIGGGATHWAWLAPEAWFRLTVPFGENNFWPLLIFMVLSAVPVILSYILLVRRDLGAGFFTQHEGSDNGSPCYNSLIALVWKQQKDSILVWAMGMALLGGTMGVAAPNISEAISSTFGHMNALWASAIVKLGNQEAFIAILIYMLGLMGGLSIFAITAVQRLWREEKDHYTEMVLSRPVSRVKWMGSYMAVAFAGSVFILFSTRDSYRPRMEHCCGRVQSFPPSVSYEPFKSTFRVDNYRYCRFVIWMAAPYRLHSQLAHTRRMDLYRDALGGRYSGLVYYAVDALCLCPLHLPNP